MNVILFGYKRCGKTYFSKLLAKQLHMDFVDTDHLIETLYHRHNKEKKTCREIHQKLGDAFFRELETKALKEISDDDNMVVAVGGGAVLRPENVKILEKMGKLIYLKLDKETLKKRMLEGELASYLDAHNVDESFEKMYTHRYPVYESIHSASIDLNGKTDEEVIEALTKIVQGEKSNGQ